MENTNIISELLDDTSKVDFNLYLNSIELFDDNTINKLFEYFIKKSYYTHLRYLVPKAKNRITFNSKNLIDEIIKNNLNISFLKVISIVDADFNILDEHSEKIIYDYLISDNFIDELRYLDELHIIKSLFKKINSKYNIVYVLNKIYIKFKISSDFEKFKSCFNL